MSAGHGSLAETSSRVEPDYERFAQLALAGSGFREIRELRVERQADSLVLTGVVPTFFQKQVAQELVRGVAGDLAVVNRVEVP